MTSTLGAGTSALLNVGTVCIVASAVTLAGISFICAISITLNRAMNKSAIINPVVIFSIISFLFPSILIPPGITMHLGKEKHHIALVLKLVSVVLSSSGLFEMIITEKFKLFTSLKSLKY